MNQEPSILDYVKSQWRRWTRRILRPFVSGADSQEELFIQIPKPGIDLQLEKQYADAKDTAAAIKSVRTFAVPWLLFLALALALIAQYTFEPRPNRSEWAGAILYLAAAVVSIWSNRRGELGLAPIPGEIEGHDLEKQKKAPSSFLFISSLVLGLMAFIGFGGDKFNKANLTLWLAAIWMLCWAFWIPPSKNLFNRALEFLGRAEWRIRVTRWGLLVLAAFAISVFFRTYMLSEVPSQMISDHAEKLWDVRDVLNGDTSVYFARNTGREFFQFYFTAGIILLFKTGLQFISLKIGNVTAGLVTLIFIYLLGKEMGNKRVGLLAMAFAGIAYWPNVISRFGLRFPFYPVFYAAALYYFVRGLRTRTRNDFIISGLMLGLGLNGYSPYRVVPMLLVIAFVLYLLHRQSEGFRSRAGWGMLAVVVISFFICLPLLRYTVNHPAVVAERTMTRLTGQEHPLPGPVWQIFLSNLWHGLTMFSWDDGEVWVLSVTHRPVLDLFSAALFHLGVVLMVIRYVRQRHWLDLFTILSIPVMMLPSILSLAFPGENPSLNRSAGAIVPVFLIIGLVLDAIMTGLEKAASNASSRRFAWVLALCLFTGASFQNYDLVFNQYRKSFDAGTWNTSEMGLLVENFGHITGSVDTAWLVGYPYWADSRLVMINAGYPDRDNAIWPNHFVDTLPDPRPKLFLINIADTTSVDALKALYPEGTLSRFQSKYPGRDFLTFFVPQTGNLPTP